MRVRLGLKKRVQRYDWEEAYVVLDTDATEDAPVFDALNKVSERVDLNVYGRPTTRPNWEAEKDVLDLLGLDDREFRID